MIQQDREARIKAAQEDNEKAQAAWEEKKQLFRDADRNKTILNWTEVMASLAKAEKDCADAQEKLKALINGDAI